MKYIINYNPNLNTDSLLEKIVYDTRSILGDVSNIDYTNKCDLLSNIVYYYLKDNNIEAYIHNTLTDISSNVIGHTYVICNYENKLYLIDPSYIQFFTKEKCNKEIYRTYKDTILLKPDPGYYINENDKETISPLINTGVIELNDKTAQIYGDSFLNTMKDTLELKSYKGFVYMNAFNKKYNTDLIDEEYIKENYIERNTKAI